MANNDSKSLLESLLFTASNNWGISEEEVMTSMNKIAFHESKGDPTAIQTSDKTESGIGPGRGLFQFEVGENEGAHTAINRLVKELEKQELGVPDFLSGLESSNYDVSKLSPEQQQLIFLGNILQMPNREEEGYGLARFQDKDEDKKISNQELAEYWAQYHQAGTKPGTKEYKDIINKFLGDMPFYKQ